MPEQVSRRGDQVTKAAFTGAFEDHPLRFGTKGLNLKDALDALEGWSRHTNADHDEEGQVTSRPGQTIFATAGTRHHSVRLLRDPGGTDIRVWGIDTNLYKGASGALSQIDSGYSGDFLTLVPHRPPLSGDPWMFVADRSKMSKVRADGLVTPIGLPAPAAAATSALNREFSRSILTFDTQDGTQAATWTPTAGNDTMGNASGPGHVTDIPGPISGNGCYFTTNVGSATSAYDSWFGHALTRDLTQLDPVGGAPGSIPASDNDILHTWMLCSHPHLVEEIRLYVVVSAAFDPTILPGTDTTGAGLNTDAYVKSFRADDFAQFIQRIQTQIDAAESARIFALRDADLAARAITDTRTSWATERSNLDPNRAISIQIGSGSNQWFGIGQIGSSVRRGDYKRIGITTGRDWATVTGVIVYIKHNISPTAQIIAVGVDDMYLTGGWGPDSVEVGAQPYDHRVTNYDPRTGAESNGSPVMAPTAFLDSIRRGINVTPAAPFGDGAIRQRIYRRGGSIINDWDFCGVNASDGGTFLDQLTDDSILAAGTIPIDHFQPVPTVDDNGTTILAQPVPALFGPIDGMLLACGDPHRPGHLYWSNADSPDHWAAEGNVEVCPPSEVLQHGGVQGHQAFVFSRERLYALYPNLAGGTGVQSAPTLCKRGLSLSRWAFVVGPGGIYFAADDGFFRTSGGPEEWIGREIQPLFDGIPKNGYLPIDKTHPEVISCTEWANKVYFTYQDTGGAMQTLVYSVLNKFWRHYTWGQSPARLQGEGDEPVLLIGGVSGKTYTNTGFNDDGAAIAAQIRTGAASGGVRAEKLFGDAQIDADRQGVNLVVQTFLNEETVTNLSQTLTDGIGRNRYILDAFGDSPQIAHSVSTDVSWSSAAAAPILYLLNYAITLQPDVTNRRVTNWDDLGSADESYVTGITLDCDTGGVVKTVVIERDFQGQKTTVATLSVVAAGRHKLKFSWPAVAANQVRIHPESDACLFWLLYRADWIFQPEPPRIAGWDVHFENAWDQYYTGLDLYCDTFGLQKQIRISVDGVFLTNTLAGLPYWPVTTSNRQVVHLTIPWGRGHVFHFEAIDNNPGLLYSHRWHLDPEPTEQANWTQNFSLLGSRADKWLKAIVFECDTFGLNKSVTVEADGVVVATLTVNTTGRKVVQLTLPTQQLGRVWRMFPVDGNPGRLYSTQPIFDEEPFCLDRWETQETNHNIPGWFYPVAAHVVLKSTQDVTLTVTMAANQTGRQVTETYLIPATGNVKQRRYVTFRAGKGVLIKYLLTSAVPFFLYRDEMTAIIQPWGATDPVTVRTFGNDNVDPTRTMTNANYAASASGGSADTTR